MFICLKITFLASRGIIEERKSGIALFQIIKIEFSEIKMTNQFIGVLIALAFTIGFIWFVKSAEKVQQKNKHNK